MNAIQSLIAEVLLRVSGKLGHGDTGRKYSPKVIDALSGLHIRKIACASHCSLALTSTGQVT